MEGKKHRPFLLYFLLVLLLFVGIGGVYGGTVLIADPTGEILQLDINFINTTSFKNYLLPGIILLIFNGLIPLFTFYSLLRQPGWNWPETMNIYKDHSWEWTFSLYSGIILVIWIYIQMLIIGYIGTIQSVFGLLGTFITILTLVPSVKDHYLKPQEYL